MITPSEAKDKVIAIELANKEEILYYKILVAYIDHYILTNFNGKNDLLILLTDDIFFISNVNMNINDDEFIYDSNGKFSNSFYSIKHRYKISHLRNSIILRKCIDDFREAGWFIKETSTYSYQFSIVKEPSIIILGFNVSKFLNIFR